ncbi:S8 family peptidase [Maribacter arenosus]|uniref:S8 family serine peptidase n=1 Tax=Maribacter arenosus TaxID=1854708 RepID=A0ABR7V6A2_9FLAO|nr:S8 family serine peptidase [Maribacter arenosus]MBD0849189.1 S8 family serine peptidase [Maribacter arenosus]
MKKSLTLLKKIYLPFFLASLFFVSCSTETNISDEAELNAVYAKSSSNKDYMVILKAESIPDGFESEMESLGATVKSVIPEIGVVVVSSSENVSNKISKKGNVRSVVPDLNVQWIDPQLHPEASPESIGSDEWFFEDLWGMDAIDAPEAWNTGQTGAGVRVAVLDSGIDGTHPDLAPNLNTDLSESFVPGEDWQVQPGFYFNHGTHVAGTIAAADNEFGVIGVAPNAEIVAVKVLSEFSGSGAFSWINAGIVYAAEIGADIINMSLGATLNKNGKFYDEDGNLTDKIPSKYIQEVIHAQQRAINYAYRNGATIVVSAGNGYTNFDGNGSTIKLPASLNNVISVSATAPESWYENPTTDLDVPASYTDYGRSHVTVSAPGGDFDSPSDFWYYDMVLSTIPGGWSWSAGTSMASPHVAGVAALIIGKNGGQMDPHAVIKQITNTADKIDGNGSSLYHGQGRVNAYRAVTE